MKHAWTKWKELAERAGNVQATIIFSLLFYVLITPVSMILRLFVDVFHQKNCKWHPIETEIDTLQMMKGQ